MSSDELKALFDLDAKAPAKADPDTEGVIADSHADTSPAVPTALQVDAWGLRRGQELAETAPFTDWGTDAHACADFHAAAFEPDPTLAAGRCEDDLRGRFMADLLQLPDYQALHQSTQLDEVAAEIAAASFAQQYTQLQEAAEKKPDTTEMEKGLDCLKAAAAAVKEADKEVESLRDTEAMLDVGGAGMGPGDKGHYDPRRTAEVFKQVRGRADLRRICDLAGRFRRLARSLQRRKVSHGMDDMVGVTTGNDLGQALPLELSRLGDEDLELDTLRRFAERQLMCREHKASEPVGRGPIIAVVDESGSMAGENIYAAKALALTMAWLARQQRRWCALVAFSGDTGERLLPLAPGKWDHAAVLEWLGQFMGGGSYRDVPVVEMPRYHQELGAPQGQTDVIFITDALCQLSQMEITTFNAWKTQAQAKVYSLVLGVSPGPLAQISDEAFMVASRLDVGELAVERVLSV